MQKDFPILTFHKQSEWRAWLDEHHATSDGVWLKFYKKNSGVQGLTHAIALDPALCYGWIDSLAKSYDEKSYLQKFTPRRSKSIWSKINTEHIERLTQEGKMKPAGFAQVEAAKKDGRWDAAYDSAATMEMPKEFLKELAKDKKAETFFKTLNKTNTYAIAWRLNTAKKPETRERRMKVLLEMLTRGKKLH